LAAHRLGGLLSIDLEGSENIHAIGAIRTDRSTAFTWSGGRNGLPAALAALDEFSAGASYVVGHNIIEHDLELLAKHASHLELLNLAAIDTLYLSPLAYPENPYHHLVKQYQEPALARAQVNDPLLDAELTLELLADVTDNLKPADEDLLLAWHALLSAGVNGHAFDHLFRTVRAAGATPSIAAAIPAIMRRLRKRGCKNQAARIANAAPSHPLALTYLLAWLPAAGGNSIIPPYVEKRFRPGTLATKLRDTRCGDRNCSWCSQHLAPEAALQRWFGFEAFRDRPQNRNGESLQRSITEKHLAREHVLGILPTGAGKSLCYQLPALMRYEATGALTVVISPLVALMADQVSAMRRGGITCATTINGLISMPERAEALAHIRLGDAGIVLVAPEQLRNRSFRKAISGRRIGAWVVDEAHCLSKWGHDFRPDYRYVARYIAEYHGEDLAPILCLTATAKHDVVDDIGEHFERTLHSRIEVIDGGAERTNLEFVVMPTSASQRVEHIHRALENALARERSGGAIVYCTTKRSTEETAQALADRGLVAEHFHSGLSPERKREVQRGFHDGDIDVVVATNAFGMGIDKPDVRAVVHAEIPGSLESYLQEAGRAGRDGAHAHCLLLFESEDTEQQFSLTARSRLERRDIQAVLRAIRRLDERRRRHHADTEDAVVATSGEILLQDDDGEFSRDRATDDDRVRTAIAWLEESKLARRDENHTSVFPSSLRVPTLAAARERIEREGKRRNIRSDVRKQMLRVVQTLTLAEPDTGVTTDELMNECGCSLQQLRRVFSTLEELGVASNDMRITVYVHARVENASTRRLALAQELEQALIAELREEAPDQEIDEWTRLALRPLAQRLREKGCSNPLPERLVRILRSISADGRDEPDAKRSIEIRARDMETIWVRLRRDWAAIRRIARLRRDGAARLLQHLIEKVPADVRGVDLLVETTYGALEQAIKDDLALRSELKNQATQPLVDRALLWMHEQEVITLNRGLTVFRPAMTLKVTRGGRTFTVADFKPLQEHYVEQTAQIHVVAEYARLGVDDIHLALRLAVDYFRLANNEFIDKWFKGKAAALRRDTLPTHYEQIVRKLGNRTQERIVADDRERTNVLVLAGPGSGKTRVLVHRIAYLIRVRRENPGSILALTYNRHAAVEARRRLDELIGNDARGVNVMTCHALAMRILGVSFAEAAANPGQEIFDNMLRDATRLLQSDETATFVTREQMLGRLNWILVDEYQDIGEPEYELISALAGKTLADDDARLNLFAVGDDDQNIYAFKGASVRYIRRFAQDYRAKEEYLVENYRSSGFIVDAANRCIEGAAERLKRDHPIRIDAGRVANPPGGPWSKRDRLSEGRVQILKVTGGRLSQAVAAVEELRRLSALDPDWQWSRCAIIARNWVDLDPVKGACLVHGIPAQSAREELSSFWRTRETQRFLTTLEASGATTIETAEIQRYRMDLPEDPWAALLAQALEELMLEESHAAVLPTAFVRNWLGDWSKEIRRRQQGLLLTSAHRAKGLEFDHVVILDGCWNSTSAAEEEDTETPRRLYYVSMTRARETLSLISLEGGDHGGSWDNSLAAGRDERASVLLQQLRGAPSVLERQAPCPEIADSRLGVRVMECTMEDVVLSFAGWSPAGSKVHHAIARLAPGDPLSIVHEDGQWKILDRTGNQVGRMARKWSPLADMAIDRAAVHGIFTRWAKDEADERYRQRLRCETWEVVVPKLQLSRRRLPAADGPQQD
jgi:ATP-dependent DNA helicase RecQ